MSTAGLLLGKFLPPHRGHQYLVEFAQAYVDELYVVVGTLAREPIPGALRHRWMQEIAPRARVIHLDEELPQEPSEHPDFWEIWRAALRRVVPARVDYVFASEDYGAPLARVLGATFVPVDPGRDAVPISATRVREAPMAAFPYLPRCVRPHYAKRVCVFGPESTGKTTLARDLARRFGTAWTPEYARVHLEAKASPESPPDAADFAAIARGQRAAEEARARDADRVLILDTDLLLTTVWAEVMLGECPPALREAAEGRLADLYLLTDVDVPFVDDPVRYLPDRRREFFARCRHALEARGLRHVVLSGDRPARAVAAVAAVTALVGPPRR